MIGVRKEDWRVEKGGMNDQSSRLCVKVCKMDFAATRIVSGGIRSGLTKIWNSYRGRCSGFKGDVISSC